jgi:predicted dehydrogenase
VPTVSAPTEHPPAAHRATVGVIGAGNALWAYLAAIDRLAARGLARPGPICARNRSAWQSILAKRPDAHLVGDASEVLESEADVVVVITPPESHAELASAAVRAGKHVVVEKPLAMEPTEARRVVEEARAAGRHLMVSPFVQLSPAFRALWTAIRGDAIGHVHSARGLYGNPGSDWAPWYHAGGVGPLAEAGIYNLKSLTALLGPVAAVQAAATTGIRPREVAGSVIDDPDPDVMHVVLHHRSGALSSIVASHAIWRYRRTGLELYGAEGTANLLGDDWDPIGFEIWRVATGSWEQYESADPTWHWSDGLRELVVALRDGIEPLVDLDHDLHVVDVIDACRTAAAGGDTVRVASGFPELGLTLAFDPAAARYHDHTRAPDEQ